MKMKALAILKIFDAVLFIVLLYFIYISYTNNLNLFDFIGLLAIVYVMVRRPDVNTVTLGALLLSVRLFDSIVFYDYENTNAYVFYAALVLFNVLAVLGTWFRSFIISNYGFGRLRHHKDLAVTHQDLVIAYVFICQAAFQLLALLEHIVRHLDDIGLSDLFDTVWWRHNAMFIYNSYPIIQLIFSVTGLAILYYMTFDASKYKRHEE
jgi:hypothetical protein